MRTRTALAPETVLRNYLHAKDENRPHLLADVFSPSATLEIVNRASSISFPSVTQGREAIADVLVRHFGQMYENVYSFYMERPPPVATRFSCDWLVAMSEKEAKNVRIGCGRYDWLFDDEAPCLAAGLVITIEAMEVLSPRALEPVLDWLQHLGYPWSSAAAVTSIAPRIDMLAPVLRYLGHRADGA
jgi:hypothetical protein